MRHVPASSFLGEMSPRAHRMTADAHTRGKGSLALATDLASILRAEEGPGRGVGRSSTLWTLTALGWTYVNVAKHRNEGSPVVEMPFIDAPCRAAPSLTSTVGLERIQPCLLLVSCHSTTPGALEYSLTGRQCDGQRASLSLISSHGPGGYRDEPDTFRLLSPEHPCSHGISTSLLYMVRNHSDRARWPCMLDIPRLISETAYKRLATRASSPSASAIRVAKNIETPRGPLSSKEVVTHGNRFGCKQAAGPLLSDLTRT
ncbi:hypothetical protein CIHG_03560 [Coccidioides immitis H538.4]|uniref:Uncharacterized protein n=3 Tax=Coccidioides immitis TaxID=5501 RepID=A0A0J8QUI4_COCIT|nr:hypothetical protein CIRG_08907 [Coccidioides immitis RMSCC 2394]KMU75725.1 hypothetical protein CISG_04898 [Coccidioides immitis RMSCC 3703]KMU86029.1 hypothetical protein CIHG_03560 [Coccidioides immitis H538.4]